MKTIKSISILLSVIMLFTMCVGLCGCGEKAGEVCEREWTEILNQISEGFETLNNLWLKNYQSPKCQ